VGNSDPVLAVIPARYASTRFPGKPLATILDRPMIEWVIEGVSQADAVDEILVATDDDRIYEAVEPTSAKPVMTSGDIESGSDRVARVVEDRTAELVVNVQGDEPLIRGETPDKGIRTMLDNPSESMGSYMTPVSGDTRNDPDVAHVVVDDDNHALYFSRASIPYNRTDAATTYEHVGIYLFRRDFLLEYSRLDSTPLEESEQLEQLRVLENGYDIKMIEIDESTVGVDRPEDVEKVESILENRRTNQGD